MNYGTTVIIAALVCSATAAALGYACANSYSDYSRSHDAVIRLYDAAGNLTETHKHKRDFKEP